jgi:hypothetical protein
LLQRLLCHECKKYADKHYKIAENIVHIHKKALGEIKSNRITENNEFCVCYWLWCNTVESRGGSGQMTMKGNLSLRLTRNISKLHLAWHAEVSAGNQKIDTGWTYRLTCCRRSRSSSQMTSLNINPRLSLTRKPWYIGAWSDPSQIFFET